MKRAAGAFVGRLPFLRELGQALAGAGAGRGELVIVSGEAGIGKTRLCEELVGLAQDGKATVAWVTCWQSGAVPAFWPWEQLVGQLTKAHLPSPPPASADADGARLELFDDVVAVLRREAAAQPPPLVLVIDDLHWADVPSVRLLEYLAPQLRNMPVVVAVTVRDHEAPTGSPLGDALAGLGRYGRHLALDGLGVAAVAALTDTAGDLTVAGAVQRQTAGNPLFATELVRLLESQGKRAELGQASGTPVPPTVRGVLSERVNRLTPPCRGMLATAAVVGDTFILDVVRALDHAADLVVVVEEAIGAGILVEAGIGRYAFAHPLMRSVLYDDLGVARRVRLHQRVGEVLEARRSAGHDVDLAALAHHFVAAAPAGTAGKAVRYAVEAADSAMAALAYEDAARLYEKAKAALDLDPSAGDRAELCIALGDALVAAGDPAAGRGAFLDAVAVARGTGRADHLARAALGVGSGGGFEVAAADRQQVDLLEEARRALGEDEPVLRAWITARLSVALFLAADLGHRLALAEDALAMARATGDPAVLAYALAAHCDAIAGPADAGRRLGEATEIVGLASARGDRAAELLGRRLRLVAFLELGDIDAADAEIEAYAGLARVIRRPIYAWYVPLWRAMRALMRGDLAGCGRWMEEGVAIGAQAGSDNASILFLALRWYWLVEAGRTDEPLDLLGPMIEFEDSLGPQLRMAITLMLAQGGRLEAARARIQADVASMAAQPVDSEWLACVAQVAELAWVIGDRAAASFVYDALLPHRDRFVVEGIGAVWPGSVERHLGMAAAALGRIAEATHHFDAAAGAHRRAGAPLLVARTLRDAGVALDDRERMAAALALYRELGIDRRVAELETRLGPAPAPAGGNVFRRDLDVWTVAYAGTTARLKDVKGLRDLAQLLARPGREIAAVDLAGAGAGPRPADGDLGDVVDTQARDAYKARLVALAQEMEAADVAGDQVRSAEAEAERRALLAQLAAAYGLGGRARKAGDPAERARTAVTWRIRDAIGRVEAAHPALGQHLRRSVSTGAFCGYDPAEPVDWSL